MATNLRIDWATHEAAKYACEKWHYSKCIPIGKQVRIGVWENQIFIGVVLFAPGACPELGAPYGLGKYEACELVRIALSKHIAPVSRIMSIAFKFLREHCPDLKLIVSFADPSEGHHGGVYQATNWVFTGSSSAGVKYWFRGKWTHPKTFRSEWSNLGHIDLSKLQRKSFPGKYRYLMPLNALIKEKVLQLAKPYPKRAVSKENVATGFRPVEGGANPTTALQIQNGNE